MIKAVRVHEHGGPEVLTYEDVEIGEPGAGEVRVRHTAIGLNFIDCYFRTGLYSAPNGLPFIPGNEAAGEVIALGKGVSGLAVGDRVAYAGPLGAYAEERNIASDRIVKLPDAIGDEDAAAMMLKGMTAEYLLLRTYPVKAGDTVLCHAAAGGVGLILGQWAKHIGATIIGTAGSPEKVALAKAHGYDQVIDYSRDNFVEAVADLTGGKKCDVVYDSVGKDTFEGSLDCLKPRGMFVSFGNASGPVPPFAPTLLSQRGSLYVTRPTLFTYIATRPELEASAGALFDVVAGGIVKINVNQRYRLQDAGQAHSDLENRKTSGATVLLT